MESFMPCCGVLPSHVDLLGEYFETLMPRWHPIFVGRQKWEKKRLRAAPLTPDEQILPDCTWVKPKRQPLQAIVLVRMPQRIVMPNGMGTALLMPIGHFIAPQALFKGKPLGRLPQAKRSAIRQGFTRGGDKGVCPIGALFPLFLSLSKNRVPARHERIEIQAP